LEELLKDARARSAVLKVRSRGRANRSGCAAAELLPQNGREDV